MKRKTNLFYTTGPDSKFLTFSNYTESLTGNFISTDHKLFPSKFLCMNIEHLNEFTKPSFIKLISAYYENKLAVLRDDCINKGHNCEDYILPLAYLVECLLHIQYDENSQEFVWNDSIDINENIELFNYVGDISEEDYDGTYSDIICMIDLSSIKVGNISNIKANNIDVANVSTSNATHDTNVLYGWTATTEDILGDIIDEYNDVKPIFDEGTEEEGSYYNYTSSLTSLVVSERNNRPFTESEAAFYNKRLPGAVRKGDVKKDEDSFISPNDKRDNFVDFLIKDKSQEIQNTYTEEEAILHNQQIEGAVKPGEPNNCPILVFNAIIPLYDLVNINYKSNSASIVENIESIELQTTISNNAYNKNVPLGMWLSTIPVEIETDRDTLMSPTWSLLISSQFKALPYYSKNIYESGIENQKILESSSTKMYNTFASVLVRQNQMIDMFTKMQMQLIDMQKRIELLQNQVSTIGTNKNIDSLHIEQTNFEIDIRKELNDFKEEVQEYFKNMTWKATI